MNDWIEIGKIVAPQGLHGELRVLSYSDFPERFLEPGERWVRLPRQSQPQSVQLLSGRAIPGKNLYVVQLDAVRDRDQAETWRGAMLLVPMSDRPNLAEGEYHVSDLVGLTVVDHRTQTLIGTVIDVFSAGHDLLEVQLHQQPPPKPGKKRRRRPVTVLIPFVEVIVPVVDLAAHRLEVLPPIGLLDTPDSGAAPLDASPDN